MASRNAEAREPVTRGTANVFADLGFPDAAERQAKLRLVYALNQVLEERKLSHADAAKVDAATRFSRRRVANDRPSEPSDAGTSTFFPARRTSRESQRAGLPHAGRRIGARACRP